MKLKLINNEIINKYLNKKGIKPLVIMLFIGVLLLIISSSDNKEKTMIRNRQNNDSREDIMSNEVHSKNNKISEEYCYKLESSLSKMIRKISGVEDVAVMVTLKSSKEEVVLKDVPYDKEDNIDEKIYSEKEETVMLEDEEGNTYPYVVKEINPTIEGVVVGIKTSNQNIKKDIIEIVQVLFDIPIHKIKIVNIK